MKRCILSIICLIMLCPFGAQAAPPQYDQGARLTLPAPDKQGGMPLMQALNNRHSSREMKTDLISQQQLSNMLWAAWGINRADGKRTVPTAHNEQQVAVFVALDSGVWFYDGLKHQLVQVMTQDIRGSLGGAPQALIYAALKTEIASPMHVGSIYQNVALYCASEGLANVPKITGANALSDVLPLPEGYVVYIFQPVGLAR